MDVCNFICQTSRGDPDSRPLLCFGPNKFAPSPGVTQIDRDWNGPGQVAAARYARFACYGGGRAALPRSAWPAAYHQLSLVYISIRPDSYYQ